jgi:predicted anti-sigma-YlaC factor YlaD
VTAFQSIWTASCDETQAAMSDHLDGEIGGMRLFRVARHLMRCEHCRGVLRSLARAVEQLRALGRPDPPAPSVVDAVLDRVRTEGPTAAAQ